MATYDLTSTTPSKIKTGDILNCPYSGSAKSITLPKGQYKLECWGAQGGNYNNFYGGAGGYSIGTLTLQNDTILYLYAGGQPASLTGSGTSAKGFNGGGSGTYHSYTSATTYCQGGGGGSDIRIGTDSLYARVIVAGGGGGSASVNALTTKVGGGIAGTSATGSFHGTQTAAGTNGSFGQGANGTVNGSNYNYAAAGGGGGWYGGGASSSYSDSDSSLRNQNGGGSGYVYTSSTASNYPSGCLLNSSYYLANAQTIAGNTAFTSPTGTSETGHTGNGYIRITVIKAGSGNTFIKIDSSPWKEQKNIFIKTPTILPSGYTQLEYLQSSGTQYINTNMFYTHVKATYEIMSVGSTYIAIFGSRTSSSSSNQFAFGYAAHQSPKLWRFDYESEHQTLDSSLVGTELPWDGKHTISIEGNNGFILIDNNEINLGFATSIEVSSALPLYLFALNTNGTAGEIGNTRIYSFKLYDTNFNFMSEKPVLNLVPARNSSGTLGMYDTISGKFYTNAGTGTFIAGPEVSPWKSVKGVWAKTAADTWSQAL